MAEAGVISETSELVVAALLRDSEFAAEVGPFIKPEYFEKSEERIVVSEFAKHVAEYNRPPTLEEVAVRVRESVESEALSDTVAAFVQRIASVDWSDAGYGKEFLRDTAEKFCQERAVENAIIESFDILKGRLRGRSRHEIPQLMQQALAVSFKVDLGHDYFGNAPERFARYTAKEEKIPFSLTGLNAATNGGVTPKTLTVFVAGVNVGKTMVLCNVAADNLVAGRNVVYFTMEMSEDQIAKRIDANLLDVPMEDLQSLKKGAFFKKLRSLYEKTNGRLIVKEFPTAAANANHLRHFLRECQIKKDFVPDVIIVDYLGIMTSVRQTKGDLYTALKAVAEEVRGLAVEYGVPVFTAAQFNRGGARSSDADMTDVAESFGLPATADLMVALFQPSEEALRDSRLMMKIIKNRFGHRGGKTQYSMCGVDYSRQRIFDIDESASQELSPAKWNEIMQRARPADVKLMNIEVD